MKTRRILSGVIIAASAVGLWAVSRLDLDLHPYLTGALVTLCAVGIIAGFMGWFAENPSHRH